MCVRYFFFLMIRRPPRSTLFPCTAVLRSTVERMQNLGEQLAAAVDSVLAKPMTPVAPKLRNAFALDRKSTRLNSSHLGISYAVFCLKKKKTKNNYTRPSDTHCSCLKRTPD